MLSEFFVQYKYERLPYIDAGYTCVEESTLAAQSAPNMIFHSTEHDETNMRITAKTIYARLSKHLRHISKK